MERHRCPSCGDKGYIDNELVCGSCGNQLKFRGERLEVAGGSKGLPKFLATFLLGGVVFSGMALSFAGWTPQQPEPVAQQPVTPPPVVSQQKNPQLDVVFVIDTTGSMADEIETVKTEMRKIIKKVQSGQPRPDVRCGLVLFRDRGDAYVTKKFALTTDLQSVESEIIRITADGGGDTPEAVSEALHVAVEEMDWNFEQRTSRMMILMGDAAPQRYSDGYDYRVELAAAKQKGIKLSTWGCSGIVDSGEAEFREMAQISGGSFDFLTYSQQVVKADGSKANIVFRGDKSYEVETTKDWKMGKKAVEKEKALPSSVVAAPKAGGYASYKTASYRASSAKLENNLDRAVCDELMNEARAKGVKY